MKQDYLSEGLILPYISFQDGPHFIPGRNTINEKELTFLTDKLNYKLGEIKAVEIPIQYFRDKYHDASIDDIPGIIEDLIPHHNPEIKLHKNRAFNALQNKKGDCIDKMCIGIALARNLDYQARGVGFDPKTAPNLKGFAFYQENECKGLALKYSAGEDSLTQFIGKIPPHMINDTATEVSDLLPILHLTIEAWERKLQKNHNEFTPKEMEKISQGIDISYHPMSEKRFTRLIAKSDTQKKKDMALIMRTASEEIGILEGHCWYEINDGERWRTFNTTKGTYVTDAIIKIMKSHRKEYVEIGLADSYEFKQLN